MNCIIIFSIIISVFNVIIWFIIVYSYNNCIPP